jgi:predicted Zn-dependent protease
MMTSQPDPTDPFVDPRDTGRNTRAVGAVLGLGVVTLAVGAMVVYSLTSSGVGPRQAVANGVKAAPTAAGVETAKAAAARYHAQGKFAEAGAILAKLIETEPTDQAARIAYAQALMGQNKYVEAYAQYEAAVALLPAGTSQRIATSGDAGAAQLHFEAGTCANMAGRLDRAEEHYSMAQTADRAEPKYPLYLAMVQLKRGGKERESAAVASLLRATHLNPDLAEAWGTLAEIELRNDHLGLAAQHLEKARTLQPDVVRWRLVEARLLNRRGEAARALSLLTALPASQRHNAAVLGVMAESHGLLKQPAEAARMYVEAFKAVTPVSAELAYQAALWSERAGDGGQARDWAKTAATLGHADARAMVERLGGV